MQLISTYVKPLVEFKVRCGYLRGSCPSGEIRLQRHPGTDSLAREQFQRQPRLATLAAAFSACHQGEVRAAPGGQSPLVLCWPGSRVSPQPRGDPRFNSHTTCMALCAKSVWLSPLSREWSNCDSRKLGGLPKVPSRSDQRSTGPRKGESCFLR